jgi:hypothetical protein
LGACKLEAHVLPIDGYFSQDLKPCLHSLIRRK